MTIAEDCVSIDIKEFADHMADVRCEALFEEEQENECNIMIFEMQDALDKNLYTKAFDYAQMLRNVSFSTYMDEIIGCYKKCAEQNNPEAMLELVRLNIDPRYQMVKPEAFNYLYRLFELGYVESFRWLGDCYYYGIGCEKDWNKANRCYFEAVLFSNCYYSNKRLKELNPDLEGYNGDDIRKRILNGLIYNDYFYDLNYGSSSEKIAEMILNGEIRDYAPETAFLLLKDEMSDDGIADYRLAECLLNGIGTEVNAVAAIDVLYEAEWKVQWTIERLNDKKEAAEALENLKEGFHDGCDFVQVLDRIEEMIAEAEAIVRKIRSQDSFWRLFDGCMTEEEVLDKWYDNLYTKIEKITRRRNG